MSFHCQLENDHRIVRYIKGLYIDTNIYYKCFSEWVHFKEIQAMKLLSSGLHREPQRELCAGLSETSIGLGDPNLFARHSVPGLGMDGARGLLWGRLRGYL